MKRSHIIIIIIIAVAVGIIISTMADSSTYVSFAEAKSMQGKEVHVVGKLNKDKEMTYNPQENANLFTFYLIDNNNFEEKVLFKGTKPQDFEKSEQVVIIGKYDNGNFYADKILMKCPSKYNEQNTQQEFKAQE